MAVISQRITHAEETVAARPALASEAERLGIRPGGTVLTIARIYRTDERPVETADIVIPVERTRRPMRFQSDRRRSSVR